MVYIFNLKDPSSFTMQSILSLYQGLNQGPPDPEADDISMCHGASPNTILCLLVIEHWLILQATLIELKHSNNLTRLVLG